MSEEIAALIMERIDARFAALEAALLERVERAVAGLRDGQPLDDFADIDPERFYTIPELTKLPGRPVSKQALYEAMNAKRLKEHLAGGPRGCLGRDYIAWLKSRRTTGRRGRPNKLVTPKAR